MLHNEARRLLVQAYEQTHDAQTVAKCFQVSTSTVYRLSGQMKKTGSVDLGGRRIIKKPRLKEGHLQDIDRPTAGQPDIAIKQIKKSFYAAERERVRCCGRERSLEGNDHTMRSGQTGISG